MAGRLAKRLWASLALTLPHPPAPACLFIRPGSKLRAESWMELWMGRVLSSPTPRNLFVGRCEGWGLLVHPGHLAQGVTSDFPSSL